MDQRQHYVPQSYQWGWTENDEGLIWVYRKNEHPKRLSIKKRVGMGINFYGDETVEKVVSDAAMESDAALVLQKIRNRAQMTPDDKKYLSRFISVFWRRVPKHKLTVSETCQEMLPAVVGKYRQEISAIPPKTKAQADRAAHLLAELDTIEEQYTAEMPDYFFLNNIKRSSIFEEALFHMDWVFFEVKKGDPYNNPFITSDAPVIFSKGCGIGDKEKGILLFPVSKDLLLQAMWITSFRNAYVPINDADVRRFNGYIAEEAYTEVYASKKSAGLMALVNRRMKT
jgi:hypothetical protein